MKTKILNFEFPRTTTKFDSIVLLFKNICTRQLIFDDRHVIRPITSPSKYHNVRISTFHVQFPLSYSSFAITKRGRCAPPFTNSKERPLVDCSSQHKGDLRVYCLPLPAGSCPPRSLTLPPFLSPSFARQCLRFWARDIHEGRSNVEQQVSR